MDFVKLGERYSSDYIPQNELIEGYNSLIWTERFGTPGEFELKSYDVAGMEALLPEDTLVSHLDTREVMMVETHDIQMEGEGADAQPEITIKGRSATIILDHRWVESKYQKKRKMRKKYSATGASLVLVWQAIDNSSGADVTRGDDDPDTEGVINNYPWNAKDDLPNVVVTETVATEGKNRNWMLEQGMLLPQLERIMAAQDLGIRVIRPVSPSPGKIVTVKTGLPNDRGDIVRTQTDDITQLQFNIYQGVDRTTGEGSIKLSLLQGHLTKPQYLRSYANYKTEAEIMSGEIEMSDIYREGDESLSGWARRAMGFDAGTPEIPPEPTKPDEPGENATRETRVDYRKAVDVYHTKMGKWRNKRDRIVTDFREEQNDAALDALKKQRKINMFAGDISSLSPWTYKVHYNLGDTVMLFGDNGKTAKMVVSEYVRTDDENGDRGFPGLVAP